MDLGALRLSPRDGAVRFAVRVKPRAKRTEILGVRGDALELGVGAPPVDGEANAEIVRALAKILSIAQRDIAIVGGLSARAKVLEIRGLDAEAVRARLGACQAMPEREPRQRGAAR